MVIKEPGTRSDPGQDSSLLHLLLGSTGEADHDPKHKVTSPLDGRLLAEPLCRNSPRDMAERRVEEVGKERDRAIEGLSVSWGIPQESTPTAAEP